MMLIGCIYCSVDAADLARLEGGGAVVLCPGVPGIPDVKESWDLSSPVVELPSSRSFSSFTTFIVPSVFSVLPSCVTPEIRLSHIQYLRMRVIVKDSCSEQQLNFSFTQKENDFIKLFLGFIHIHWNRIFTFLRLFFRVSTTNLCKSIVCITNVFDGNPCIKWKVPGTASRDKLITNGWIS